MKITRDVITDLLPVYFANEASADTKALIDEFLKSDPAFAKLISQNKNILPENEINLTKENEMNTLNKTKKLLQKRVIYLAFTILFFLMPVSFRFDENGFSWMWSDMPIIAVIFLILAIFFGIQYRMTNNKLKDSDL